MGHEGYLTEVYRRYSYDYLGEKYKEGEHVLAIFTSPSEYGKLKQVVEDQSKIFSSRVRELEVEKQRLKERVSQLEEASKNLAEKVKKLLKASQLSE